VQQGLPSGDDGGVGTGSLRCANKKQRVDGPPPHGFIQQTRPGAGVLRRGREAATTPHGRGLVVHSPHHAVTASVAKRPSPGVARPKSHGSRQRRHRIASLRSQRRVVFNLATVSPNGIGRNGRCELAMTAEIAFFSFHGCNALAVGWRCFAAPTRKRSVDPVTRGGLHPDLCDDIPRDAVTAF